MPAGGVLTSSFDPVSSGVKASSLSETLQTPTIFEGNTRGDGKALGDGFDPKEGLCDGDDDGGPKPPKVSDPLRVF
jgi:hypothetical protein